MVARLAKVRVRASSGVALAGRGQRPDSAENRRGAQERVPLFLPDRVSRAAQPGVTRSGKNHRRSMRRGPRALLGQTRRVSPLVPPRPGRNCAISLGRSSRSVLLARPTRRILGCNREHRGLSTKCREQRDDGVGCRRVLVAKLVLQSEDEGVPQAPSYRRTDQPDRR